MPPEPTSTSMVLFDSDLAMGAHDFPLPDRVPTEAAFATVTVDTEGRVFTVGAMPDAVMRMVPTSPADQRLPAVTAVTTHGDDR